MPNYDYRCDEHGEFEQQNKIDQRAKGVCPTCSEDCPKVILSAPALDGTAMANLGMPGALEKQGNDLYKRHTSVDQVHRLVEGRG